MKAVFVDTSGFYAVLDGADPFHVGADDCFRRALADAWELVTTSYVVHETWAIIQSRLGWDALDAWRDQLLALCEIVWVDESLHALGEARCRQARTRRLSLTDCVSIELMHRRGIRSAIANDAHFQREGLLLP